MRLDGGATVMRLLVFKDLLAFALKLVGCFKYYLEMEVQEMKITFLVSYEDKCQHSSPYDPRPLSLQLCRIYL